MADIEIKGLTELQAQLGKLEGAEYMHQVLKAAGSMLKAYIAEYPPASGANSPGQRRWYERGYGPKWTRKDGSVGGSRTSEALGRRWTVKSEPMSVTVGNNASYAPFVQSAEKQASVHKRHGWRTDEQAIAEMQPKIESMALAEIARVLEGK